ncbi:type II toxin-antitoxin system VapC family toxin [bacterium]|nr:type II toxin-antitoxin system VapC family toxin [bacterium]
MKYLLDTNLLSEAIKPKPHSGVLARLQDPDLKLATAAVVWLELRQGFERLPTGRRKTIVGEYLHGLRGSNLQILDYTEACAELQAQFSAALTRQGRPVPLVDAMIASTALVYNLTLVTRNRSDFEAIPNLRLEDWFD